MKMFNSVVVAVGLVASFALHAGELPPAAAKKDVSYAADIKPILDKNCVDCHGPDKQKSKLRLDSLEAVLKGSEDGEVVKPGDSAKSQLVKSVAHVGDPDLFMPKAPKGKKAEPLTTDEVGLIRAWIDQGAK